MPESIDVYADQVGVNLGPFGCALNFAVSAPLPAPGGVVAPGQAVATVRMSLEHLKLMVFLLRRQVKEYERGAGLQIPLPQEVLNQLRVGREDWDECWEPR
jgi:hypothetical protein